MNSVVLYAARMRLCLLTIAYRKGRSDQAEQGPAEADLVRLVHLVHPVLLASLVLQAGDQQRQALCR